MDNFGIFLIYAAITAFSFFVCAPMILNAISTFGVQKKFAREMIERRIVSEETIKNFESKKQIAGVAIALIITGVLVAVSVRVNYGLICMCVGLFAGLVRYRHILQFNNLTVKRFRNTYEGYYDTKKLDEYIKETF